MYTSGVLNSTIEVCTGCIAINSISGTNAHPNKTLPSTIWTINLGSNLACGRRNHQLGTTPNHSGLYPNSRSPHTKLRMCLTAFCDTNQSRGLLTLPLSLAAAEMVPATRQLPKTGIWWHWTWWLGPMPSGLYQSGSSDRHVWCRIDNCCLSWSGLCRYCVY